MNAKDIENIKLAQQLVKGQDWIEEEFVKAGLLK